MATSASNASMAARMWRHSADSRRELRARRPRFAGRALAHEPGERDRRVVPTGEALRRPLVRYSGPEKQARSATMAAKNKCLAQSDESQGRGDATKQRNGQTLGDVLAYLFEGRPWLSNLSIYRLP